MKSAVASDRRGVAAIEFAILAPLLILMIAAILIYGDYFIMAHSIQQLANYDSSSSPIWSLQGLLPMPPALIVRSAAIQLGGY